MNPKKLSKRQFNKILSRHRLWLESDRRTGEKADFSEYDLMFQDMTGMNISLGNFSKADLRGAKFNSAILKNAVFEEANLQLAEFIESDLTETNFSNANMANANLTNANLTRAALVSVSLILGNLNGANLTDAFLMGSNLTLAKTSKTIFTGSNLIDTILSRLSDIASADWTGVKYLERALTDVETRSMIEAALQVKVGTSIEGRNHNESRDTDGDSVALHFRRSV